MHLESSRSAVWRSVLCSLFGRLGWCPYAIGVRLPFAVDAAMLRDTYGRLWAAAEPSEPQVSSVALGGSDASSVLFGFKLRSVSSFSSAQRDLYMLEWHALAESGSHAGVLVIGKSNYSTRQQMAEVGVTCSVMAVVVESSCCAAGAIEAAIALMQMQLSGFSFQIQEG